MSATLEVTDDCDEKRNVFLVNFTNGHLLPSAQHEPKFTLYQKTNDRTKQKRIVVAETDQMAYVGSNYDSDSVTAGAGSMCKYYIGALDKESGTMSLHRAEMFTLNPYIPGKTDTDLSEFSPTKMDWRKIGSELVTSFGSERQKQAYAAAKRNKLEADALETALASAVTHAQAGVEEAAPDVASVNSSGLLPPHNPSAQTPQDVYDLNNIVTLEEIRALKMTAQEFTNAPPGSVGKWRAENMYPEYVLQHVSLLPPHDPQRGLKAALLLYASYLIQMFTMDSRSFAKRGLSLLSGVKPPFGVKQQLLSKFTERTENEGGKPTYLLTQRMKDKVLSYLLVLTLTLDDFSVDCTTLQQDLKATTSKLMDYFRALGCTVTRSKVKRKADEDVPLPASCTATLTIPLNFPKLKKGKKRRN